MQSVVCYVYYTGNKLAVSEKMQKLSSRMQVIIELRGGEQQGKILCNSLLQHAETFETFQCSLASDFSQTS